MCTVIFESRDKMSEEMIKIKLPLNYKKMNSNDKTFEKTYKREIKNSEVSGYYKIFNALKYIMKWGVAFYIFMILIRGIYEAFWLDANMVLRIITTISMVVMSYQIMKTLATHSIDTFDKAVTLNIIPIKYQGNVQIRYILKTWLYAIIQSFLAFALLPVIINIVKEISSNDSSGYAIAIIAVLAMILSFRTTFGVYKMTQIFVGALIYIIDTFYDNIYKKKPETHTLVQDYIAVMDILNTIVISKRDGRKHLYDYLHEIKGDDVILKNIPHQSVEIITVEKQMKSKDSRLLEGQLNLKDMRIKLSHLEKEGA